MYTCRLKLKVSILKVTGLGSFGLAISQPASGEVRNHFQQDEEARKLLEQVVDGQILPKKYGGFDG